MNVLVNYDNGVTLSYSLNAFDAWEGYVDRLQRHQGPPRAQDGRGGHARRRREDAQRLDVKADGTYIRVYPMRKPAYQVPARNSEGGHGGGDEVMLADLFAPNRPADPLLARRRRAQRRVLHPDGNRRQPLLPPPDGGD